MRLLRHRVRRTTLISIGCAAFLAGVGGVKLPLPWAVTAPVLLCAVPCLLLCARKRAVLALPAVVVLGLLVGLWRGGQMQAGLDGYGQFISRKVYVTGTINEDPTYGNKNQLDLRLSGVAVNGQPLPGTVRVTTFQPIDPKRGDRVRAYGTLRDGFGNYDAAAYYASTEVIGKNMSWLEQARRYFAASVYNAIPEPQASLGLGFLLGLKSTLPDQLSDQLKILGLTHIVVASGYNLTILVRLSRRLFANRSKFQAAAASGGLIAAFLTVTGFSPSMTRAGLVAMLSLAAWYYGRKTHPITLLLFAAALTGFANPLYVWGDLGWYLSFLAFAGVMLVAPLLTRRLFGQREPPMLVQICIETTSAQILTLPLILCIFGELALLALPANLLVLPFIPLAMLLTFVAGAAGLASPVLGAWVALPANWLLGYMVEMVNLLAQIPWAQTTFQITALVMLAVYGALVLAGIVMYRKLKFDYLKAPGLVE